MTGRCGSPTACMHRITTTSAIERNAACRFVIALTSWFGHKQWDGLLLNLRHRNVPDSRSVIFQSQNEK
jgi:hypothetical protein